MRRDTSTRQSRQPLSPSLLHNVSPRPSAVPCSGSKRSVSDSTISKNYCEHVRWDPAELAAVRSVSVVLKLFTHKKANRISLATPPSHALTLGSSDVFKITFQVVDEEGKGVQPHQTFLRFYDPATDEEGISPVRVTAGGKAKFELNMAKPPLSFPPTTSTPLKVSLFIGAPSHSPLKVNLGELVVPPSGVASPHPEESLYHSLPPLAHTFNPEPKLPPRFISATAAAAVVAPWVILLGMVSLPFTHPWLNM